MITMGFKCALFQNFVNYAEVGQLKIFDAIVILKPIVTHMEKRSRF